MNNKMMIKNIKKNHANTYTTGVALAAFFGGIVISAFIFSGAMKVDFDGELPLSFDAATTIIVVLTSLSVMITVLAIIIAIIGAIGFTNLKKEAYLAGNDHAKEQLQRGGELRSIIERRVDEVLARLHKGEDVDRDWNPESEYGE